MSESFQDVKRISIRAPNERSDSRRKNSQKDLLQFQSALPMKGATREHKFKGLTGQYFNPRSQ